MSAAGRTGQEGLRELRSRVVAKRDNRQSHSACTYSQRDAPESSSRATSNGRCSTSTSNNTPELLEAEYGPYEGSTVFVCALDHQTGTSGRCHPTRMPSPAGLKSLGDVSPFGVIASTMCSANEPPPSRPTAPGTSPPSPSTRVPRSGDGRPREPRLSRRGSARAAM